MASYIHEKVFMLLFSWKGMFSPVERMCEIVYVCSYKSCWVCVEGGVKGLPGTMCMCVWVFISAIRLRQQVAFV